MSYLLDTNACIQFLSDRDSPVKRKLLSIRLEIAAPIRARA